MGQHKASLMWRGVPLYLHCLHLLLPFCSSVLLSLPFHHPLYPLLSTHLPPNVELVEDDLSLGDIGPAIGLLSAHARHPAASLLVFAVDFPLAPPAAFTHLLSCHRSTRPLVPVSCYVHEDGNPEPLLSVWEPAALEALRRNAERGVTGPCATIRQVLGLPSKATRGGVEKGRREQVGLQSEQDTGERKEDVVGRDAGENGGGRVEATPAGLVRPPSEKWLFNCNSTEQWQVALERDRLEGWEAAMPCRR